MIERHYFYHARWNHQDGSPSYSYIHGTLAVKSWFVDSTALYNHIVDKVCSDYKDKYPNGSFEITSISRL